MPESRVLAVANQIAQYDPRAAWIEAVEKRKKAQGYIYEARALLFSSQYPDPDPAVNDLIDELTHVRSSSNAMDLRVPRGGKHFKWKRKVYTSSGCWLLLKQYTDERPTTHLTGKWVWFSEGMFYIATGEDTDMKKACLEWNRQQNDMLAIARRAGVTARVVIREWQR
jgi:hypothetical protein